MADLCTIETGVMKQCLLFALLILGWGALAPAQSTQPASAPPPAPSTPQLTGWPLVVNQLATSLVSGNQDDFHALCDSRVVIRGIKNGAEPEDASRLLARVSRETVLGAHGYFYPPLSMAADISADAKGAARMSQVEKARMSPPDDSSMKQANATAAQWIGDTLGAADRQPVAVILFWCDGDPDNQRLGPPPGLVFVLVKGQELEKGLFKITLIAYGNPLAPTR